MFWIFRILEFFWIFSSFSNVFGFLTFSIFFGFLNFFKCLGILGFFKKNDNQMSCRCPQQRRQNCWRFFRKWKNKLKKRENLKHTIVIVVLWGSIHRVDVEIKVTKHETKLIQHHSKLIKQWLIGIKACKQIKSKIDYKPNELLFTEIDQRRGKHLKAFGSNHNRITSITLTHSFNNLNHSSSDITSKLVS